jgi:hypothetical protein
MFVLPIIQRQVRHLKAFKYIKNITSVNAEHEFGSNEV